MARTIVKAVEKRITDQLQQKLLGAGFRKRGESLIARGWGDAEAQIRCAVRKDRVTRRLLIFLMLGLRFDAIEKVLGRAGNESRPTFARPIHSLHANKQNAEWDANDTETLEVLRNEIETYAFPFFQKHSRFEALLEALQSENPQNWYWLGSEGRLETLAAALVVCGRAESAVEVLNQEIAAKQRSSMPPDVALRARLRQLRERLAAWPCERGEKGDDVCGR